MGYEFNEQENESLSSLATLMRLFAQSLFLVGAMQAVYVCVSAQEVLSQSPTMVPTLAATLVAGLVCMGVALFLKQAAERFDAIVETEGNDVDHLMTAFTKLQNFFKVTGAAVWLLALGLAVTIVMGLKA